MKIYAQATDGIIHRPYRNSVVDGTDDIDDNTREGVYVRLDSEVSQQFFLHDTVIIREGTLDPDWEADLAGWQGEITDIFEEQSETFITVTWDAATIAQMDPVMIDYFEREGMSWHSATFAPDDLTLVARNEPNNTHEDASWEPCFLELTAARVKQLADSAAIFLRGEQYERHGYIKQLTARNGELHATIRGSNGASYSVSVTGSHHHLQTSCSCPYSGVVCKHVVAVLLRFVKAELPKITEKTNTGPIHIDTVTAPEDIATLVANMHGHPAPGASSPSPRPEAPLTLIDIFRSAGNISQIFARSPHGAEAKSELLLDKGLVVIQHFDDEYADINVRTLDSRIYQVSIHAGNGSFRNVGFTCTCSLYRNNPTTRCEHIAAASLALHRLARKDAQPEQSVTKANEQWEFRLAQVLEGIKKPRTTKSRAVLLFSLQERYGGSGWRLAAYTIPASLIDTPSLDNREALQAEVIELANRYEIKEVSYSGQSPSNLLYASPELIGIARQLNLANIYQYNSPIAFALPLLGDALLFRGTGEYSSARFVEPIRQIDPTPRPLQLSLAQAEGGTRLVPAIDDGETEHQLLPNDVTIVCHEPLWVLLDKRLLRIEGDPSLLKGMLASRDIIIPGTETKTFVSRYLPKLLDHAEVSGDAVEQREDIDIAPTRRIYLREKDETILVDLAFAYGAFELPLDTRWPETALQYDEDRNALVNIHRACDIEEDAWRAMNAFGLKRDGDAFTLRQRVTPADFLLRYLPQLHEAGYEVYGEDTIKNTRINRSTPTMRMRVSSGIDWFDVMAVISFGDMEVALSEVRKAIKQRRGYVKLPDGSLGALPDEFLARFRHLFIMGTATDTGIRLSKTQATLLELALQGTDATVDKEYSQHIERLHTFNGITRRQLPEGFRGELRPYQHAGYDWLHFLHDYGFGGCLADDMGIGKTVQTLVFLESLYASGHTKAASLIVMPRSLLENWAREAARFTPDLKVLIHADGDRSEDQTTFDDAHLVLTTYGVMLRDLELFRKYRFHFVVLDEAQAIKNPAAQTSRAARMLLTDHRLALSGTPVENSTEELWSLFSFLNPGQLGSQDAFREHFATPIQRAGDESAAQTLRALVRPFILRRTKEQVAPELPPRTERLIYCAMSPSQQKLYQRTRDRYRAELLGMIDSDGMQQARFKVLEGLLRLRQLANDPRLVDKSYKGMSSKFEALLESMEVLRDGGHKALIFSQFTSMLGLLRSSLDTRNWPYLYLDGKTKNRQELVDRFQTDESIPYFLISLKAGGTGLNLTAADYVIHIDPWWNPAVERQATDRTHRIGQDRPVMVYKFIAEDTVEEKILQLQDKKQALVDQLITTESSFIKSLTRDDVAALFE